jgi:Nucleotidyl transferase AbiEii toxin, Type IV TA system
MFEPKLEILPTAQRAVWPRLAEVPSPFVLCGGTAVALQLGHRQSVDFDFFGSLSFDPQQLYSTLPCLARATVVQQAASTLTCRIGEDDPVIISFFGMPWMKRVTPALVAPDNRLRVASLLDLAGMKAAVVQQRAEAKDYIDLHALIEAGVGLPQALAAAGVIYGPRFNPQLTLKALSFFGDGDLPSLPARVRERITGAVKAVDLDRLPVLVACVERGDSRGEREA